MHIALYSPAWPLERQPSGIVTYVHAMRSAFIDKGHAVSVFACDVDEFDTRPDSNVYRVKPSPGRDLLMRLGDWAHPAERLLYDFGWSIGTAMRRVDAKHRIDVVEIEESFGWFSKVRSVLNRPVAVKLHGPGFLANADVGSPNPALARRIRIEGKALGDADLVVSPAAHTLASTLTRYGIDAARGRHVPNPVADPGSPVWRADACEPATVLFVGRFDRLKGGDVVLQGFGHLLERHPEARLTFVGPDVGLRDETGKVRKVAEYAASVLSPNALARVSFLGTCTPPEIVRLRLKASVTLIASRWENQPYTCLEAMLQGCPIVCCDIAGLAEIVETGVSGLHFRSEDPRDLAAKLALLLDNRELGPALGAAARAYVRASHLPTAIAERALTIYRELLQGSAARLPRGR